MEVNFGLSRTSVTTHVHAIHPFSITAKHLPSLSGTDDAHVLVRWYTVGKRVRFVRDEGRSGDHEPTFGDFFGLVRDDVYCSIQDV